MPKDLPLLPRRPLCERVFPRAKLRVTRLDLQLSQPRLVCERGSLSVNLQVRPPEKAMQQPQPARLPRALFCLRDALQEKAIRPESATALAKYKCRQIQQQR
jgi:hypothetical protein